ncbi:MAG: hypothetical protein ACKOT0_02540 [bacterium]
MNRRGAVSAVVALVLAPLLGAGLSACSEIRALTPVGGDSITAVRNAVNIVLVEQQVDILVAPVCAAADTGFACRGTTVDGADIVATATGSAPYDLSIAIGGETVFTGTAQAVLESALETPS